MRRVREQLEHTRRALGALVLLHWLAVLVFALVVEHNGWLYYQGGDQIWHTTTAWLLGHGNLPPTQVGYVWPALISPAVLLGGGDFVDALPFVVLLNVLVLGPLAIASLYGLGALLAGRLFGLFAAAVWVTAPYLAIPLFVERYHDRYVEQFLPQALGLTAMSDYPSLVALLGCAYLLVRSLQPGEPRAALGTAAAAGLLAGLAIGLKPSNALFLVGAGLAYAVAARPREAVEFGLAVLPSLIVLLLWKQRGLGELPVVLPAERLAGTDTVAVAGLERYVDLDWANFRRNMADLREYFYSVRVLQWIPFAGLLAIGLRSRALAALLAGWFGTFLVLKGTTPLSTVASGSFFRFLLPAAPAYLLFLAAIPLLVPGLGRRLGAPDRAGPLRIRPALLAGAAALTVFVPLAWTALARPVTSSAQAVIANGILVRVDDRLTATAAAGPAGTRLSWEPGEYATSVFYRVLRAPVGSDTVCVETGGALDCTLEMEAIGSTRDGAYVDAEGSNAYVYRIGVAANWRDDPEGGDIFAVGPPVTPR